MPHTAAPGCCTSPVGGDPSKPGAWTQAQIDEWNRVKACDHSAFWASDPRPHEDTCGACGSIVRSVTTSEGWADHWAEERKEGGGFIRPRRPF